MIIVIVGPTGVGKTKLSVALAHILDGEIINADSTQIYRGMNIGTAKVTEEEKEGVPHHLFDIRDVTDEYTVYDYQKDARKVIDDILARHKTPIMVGGSGLYIKAALYDYNFEEEHHSYDYSHLSNEELYDKLKKIDPNTSIHINNRKRMERALTKYANTGSINSDVTSKPLYDAIFIGLTTDRERLYDRINKRVDKMVKDGLIDETKSFYDKGLRTKALMTPICYKELYSYFDGTITLDEALDLIRKRSRNYAKRQYTWFRHQLPVKWVDVDFNNFDETISQVQTIVS